MSLDDILYEIKEAAINTVKEKIDEKIRGAEKIIEECNKRKEKNDKEFNSENKVELIFVRLEKNNGNHSIRKFKVFSFDLKSNQDVYDDYLLANKSFDQRISEVRKLILDLNELKDKIAAMKNFDESFLLLDKRKDERPETEKAKIIEKSSEKITEISEKRPPNRGELKELCVKFADELGLVKGKKLTTEQIAKVAALIDKEGIIPNLGSIAAKLRDLGYKKEKH